MNFIDTFPHILYLHRQVSVNPDKVWDYWEQYITRAALELKELVIKDSRSYSFQTKIKPVLIASLTFDFPRIEAAHKNLLALLGNITPRFRQVFGDQQKILLYFYCGLCNGAGWATIIERKPAILLGAEKIAELAWHDQSHMESLVCHELGHIAHSLLRGEKLAKKLRLPSEQAVWQLYLEGYAQRQQQTLLGYEAYHQDKNGWLFWCQNNLPTIALEYLTRIETDAIVQDFFGDWVSWRGRSDVGYFLGCEFIKSLEADLSPQELAGLDLDQLMLLLPNYLRKTAAGI